VPFAQANGLDVFYEFLGSGPRLLYISGTGGDLRKQPRVADSPLVRNFQVLAYDQRGLGRTSKPEKQYEMADYAGDAVALLDAVGWDRCLVVGVSFGGMVAQELAIGVPERIERLVMCCTSSGGAGNPSYPLHELQDLDLEERISRRVALLDTRQSPEWQRQNPDGYAEIRKFHLEREAVGASEPGREDGYRRQLDARRGHDTFDRLSQIRLPVLICAGRYDRIAPPENQEALHNQIPNSRLEFFEGGHRFYIEDPRAYETMIAFLNEA
jgi:3-oxoadipate enol-lactonase